MARHDHAAHGHSVRVDADRDKLVFALGLILVFMLAEVTAGVLAHSLALLSDAAHMLTDAAALGLSLVAIRLAARPAGSSMTYGYKRAEILSAQFNGATLLVLGALIVYGGIGRLFDPPGVDGAAVLVVAVVGIFVNLAATYTLSKANRRSMNIEGSFQHLLADLLAFVFTAVAGAVILTTGFVRADGIASLLVAAVMLRAAYSLLRDSGRVFLEAAPAGMDPQAIGRAMVALPGVVEVHDLHVWEVTSGFPALSAHVLVGSAADCHEVRFRLDRALHEEFAIDHVTLQVDHQPSELIGIESRKGRVAPNGPRTCVDKLHAQMSAPRRPEVADRPPSPFSVAISAGDGPLIATVAGDVDLASADELQASVFAALDARAVHGVILDFTDVGFMDSTGLRALLEISRRLELRPDSVVLLSPNRSVRKLMTLAGLDERVPIAASLAQAESQLLSGN